MTINDDTVDSEVPQLVPALLGRAHPGAVRDRWWRGEYRFRLEAFVAAHPEPAVGEIDSAALVKVFEHPVVGAIARSDAEGPRRHWAPVSAALRVSADPEGAVTELFAAAPRSGPSVHLPGTGLVCDISTGNMRSLPVIGGIELNNVDQSLTALSDHVDTDLTFDWCALVGEAQSFITELGSSDFIDVASLTTVLVPLRQRDGGDFGRSSRFEIESGSVTDAVGAAFISPGSGEPVNLAEALIHESYHNLFNMALELGDFEKENAEEFYAPWKGATRPTRAVLHGIVAFSAVMRFWQQISRTQTSWSNYADELVARRAEEVLGAATAVTAAGVLTDTGAELADAAASAARAVV